MPDYFVLADGMTNPSGHRIWKDPQGRRRITMSPAQAQYWIDQGAISDRPLESHSLHGRGLLGQMSGNLDVPMPKGMKARQDKAKAEDDKVTRRSK